MTTLVIGGSCSGKSEYAEQCLDGAAGEKIYLATMIASDPESLERVRRHRQARALRQFRTIECPVDLEKAAGTISDGAAILLEGIGTLAANELFRGSLPADFYDAGTRCDSEPEGTMAPVRTCPEAEGTMVSGRTCPEPPYAAAQERILRGIRMLASRSGQLVIVSDEVNRAGCEYEGDTVLYQELVGKLNQELCRLSDRVVEMVCGCPVDRKRDT